MYDQITHHPASGLTLTTRFDLSWGCWIAFDGDTPEAERTDAHIDMICEAIDLAWKELSHDDKLVVYNTVQFVHQNIKPKSTLEKAADAVDPKPLIQLLH